MLPPWRKLGAHVPLPPLVGAFRVESEFKVVSPYCVVEYGWIMFQKAPMSSMTTASVSISWITLFRQRMLTSLADAFLSEIPSERRTYRESIFIYGPDDSTQPVYGGRVDYPCLD
jgi:hypothetical protein